MVLFSRAQLTAVGFLLLATTISIHDYCSKPQKAIGNTQEIIVAQNDVKGTPSDLAELARHIITASDEPDISPQAIEEKENVIQVASGDTMMSMLTKVGIKKEDAVRAIAALKSVYDLRDLKVGQEINLQYTKDPSKENASLGGISFKSSPEHEINLEAKKDGHYSAKKYEIALKKIQRRVSGTVHSSFYSAALKRGVPPQVVREAINALAYDINWQHDPKSGDKFEIVYVAYQDETGNIVKSGELKYAAFAPGGNMRRIYRFQPKNGAQGYFNERGESVIKTLLQTPMDPSKMRVTSKFGIRNHPILKFSKHHKGTDFGAASGTPVRSAGDGVVVRASYWGHYGNYVMIKHNNDYSTAYAHLSKMKVKVGQRVRQSQIIGNVGSTGRTTGPHLHYEVIYRGKHVNPQGIKQMPCARLNAGDLARFRQAKLEIEREVAGIPLTPVSAPQIASAHVPNRTS